MASGLNLSSDSYASEWFYFLYTLIHRSLPPARLVMRDVKQGMTGQQGGWGTWNRCRRKKTGLPLEENSHSVLEIFVPNWILRLKANGGWIHRAGPLGAVHTLNMWRMLKEVTLGLQIFSQTSFFWNPNYCSYISLITRVSSALGTQTYT